MDQRELRELEGRCIQDEAPKCEAACPIHVDGRAFAGLAAKGDWPAAWKILAKTMPFPGVLARICDAPCKKACKRGEAGDPIEMGAIERVCAEMSPTAQIRIHPLPSKGKCVSIVGSGLSGLTVALDLAKKGYTIRIFEPGPRLGGDLPDQSPEPVLEKELAPLLSLDVKVHLDADIQSRLFWESRLSESDAVYLGLDGAFAETWPLDRDKDGQIILDPLIRSTSFEKVFAGGRDPSPVWRAAHGRWAATSMDRFIQKVSLTAGREKQGPYSTRLFTSLEGVRPLNRVVPADGDAGYTVDEAAKEAGRCLQCQCLECVKVCVYLEKFGSYPRKYVREIYNNESIVMGMRQANKLINSCSLCGLCQRVCPEDFAMHTLCLEARRGMVQRGKMPPSAHEFALEDMRFSLGDEFRMVRNAPGFDHSEHVFFPGCQLCASAPEQVRKTYSLLLESIGPQVGLMLGCCGAPAFWAGRKEEFSKARDDFFENWKTLGKPRVVTACSTCFQMFSEHLPQLPVISLWQVLENAGLPRANPVERNLAIHDPCTTRPYPEIQKAVRNLSNRLGMHLEEPALSGDKTECCGFGGLMQNANPDLAKEVAAKRAAASSLDYLTYCAMCRDSLAGEGKRALHLLDLIFPDSESTDSGARPRPGWSDRRENRARLKASLASDIWGERTKAMEEYEKIILDISPQVEEILEKRRILKGDIQQVVFAAEKGGQSVVHPGTGRIKACFRPFRTTIWVEYSKESDGYRIHTAYSHRMNILGGKGA